MAKVKVDVSGFKKKLNAISKVIDSKKLYDEIGETTVKYIQGNARIGKDLSTGKAIKPITTNTVDWRKRYSKVNSTDPSYKPEKSNLTFTGQLLGSLIWKRFKGFVRIFPDGKRIPYKTLKGKMFKKTPTNQQLAQYQKDMGRTFLGLDDKINKIINNIIKRTIRRNFRK